MGAHRDAAGGIGRILLDQRIRRPSRFTTPSVKLLPATFAVGSVGVGERSGCPIDAIDRPARRAGEVVAALRRHIRMAHILAEANGGSTGATRSVAGSESPAA
jgi:hypothetical protein